MAQPPRPSSGSMKAFKPEEMLFGQIVIKKGYATEAQVKECLRIQATAPKDAQGRAMRLGDLLMKKGYIAMEAIEDVLATRASLTVLTCPVCGHVAHLAKYDPSKPVHCKAVTDAGPCNSIMRAPESGKTVSPSGTPRPSFKFMAVPDEVREAAAEPRKNFGKYVLVKEIGRGGMGVVFKAWDTSLNRMVAVKFLTGDTTEDDVQRFFREAQTAASLTHTNIAGVFDMGELDGKYYLSMQFIDGHSMHGRKLPPPRAAEIIRTIALAVDYAHAANIIHRDIKPHNIMVDKAGHPFIMDFGLAKSMKGKSQLTQSGMIMGTPSYMAPEQAEGRTAAIGKKSDVYSLGATFYELVTGRPPFRGANPLETMMQVVKKDPMPPSLTVPRLPSEIDTIILKCMEKNPAARYPSAKALADELGRFLRGDSILAQPPTLITRVKKRVAKNRAVLLPFIAAAFVIVAALAGLVVWNAHRTEQARGYVAQADRKFDANQFDEALGLYNQALGLDRDNAKVKDRIAQCQAKLDAATLASQKAREDAERRKREVEDKEKTRLAAGPIVGKGKEALEQAEKDLYRQGADLDVSRQKARDAIKLFDEALKICPDHADAFYYRGRARLFCLDAAAAEQDFTKAIAASPGYAPALVARGKLRIQRWIDAYIDSGGGTYLKGKSAEASEAARRNAAEDFAAAAKAGEGERQAAFDAMSLFAQKDFPPGLKACDRALAANDTDEELYKLRGDILFFDSGFNLNNQKNDDGLRKLQEALKCYDRAIKLRTNFPEARAMRAETEIILGNREGARDDLEAALNIDGRSFITLILLAKLISDAGSLADIRRSTDLYTTAIQVKPDSYFARVNRGADFAALEKESESLADIDAAIALNPDHVWAWQLKGGVLGHFGKLKEAEDVLTKAIDIEPTLATTWYNRGAVRANMKENAGAISDFEEAIKLKHPDVARIRQIIESLKKP